MKKLDASIYRFRHFAYRLSERYGILITFEYYCLLSGLFLQNVKMVKEGTDQQALEGIITIQGTKVRVRKQLRGHKLLLTALPIKKNHGTNRQTGKLLPSVCSQR